MGRAVSAVLIVLSLAGCSQASTNGDVALPPRFDSGPEVRDALIKSGLGCDGFRPIGRHHRDFGEEDAVETDSCRVDNEDVIISIWGGLGQKQDWARTRAGLGCQFADSLGSTPPIYVDGGRWTITVQSRALANRISQAIGGEPTFTDCRSLD